jgi:uncharacterized membrane protein YeaQ/YmgE (transglycosylase-associated protein family)
MGIMHILWSVVVGFFVGIVARALMPGADQIGFLATSLLGILGSLLGGFVGGLISRPKEGSIVHPPGFILSVIGAMIVLFVWHRVRS